MGLDMYMIRAKKLRKNDAEYNKLVIETSEEVAYWRKANQIRKWIVDNCGYDTDSNCEYFLITKEQLEKLKEDLNAIIKDNSLAEKLFPTEGKFFFGSTEYDDWYFDKLKESKKKISEILKETDFDKEDIYYYESW